MKIVSFNTQHCFDYIEKKIDFDKFADTIKSLDADVVGLNEMRGEGTDAEYTEQVKILSELTGMKYYYFAKAIDIQGKGPYGNGMLSKIPILGVETVKIPDPDPKKYSGYYETRCVLMGDFNVRPENPVLAPIREKMQDTAEVFEGERLSFPSDAPDRKIDYLFVSRDVRVLDADIPEIVVSDHRPYTVTVEI